MDAKLLLCDFLFTFVLPESDDLSSPSHVRIISLSNLRMQNSFTAREHCRETKNEIDLFVVFLAILVQAYSNAQRKKFGVGNIDAKLFGDRSRRNNKNKNC